MNESIVLDANIIAKLIADEPGSAIAARVLVDPRFSFFVPGHALAEVLEVVCRKIRSGEALEEQLAVSLPALATAFVSVPIGPLLEPALRLSLDHRISFYDALYLALAVERNAKLLTDDAKLARIFANTRLGRHFVSLAAMSSEFGLA